MNEIIAKKYVQALKESVDKDALENVAEFFEALGDVLDDPKVAAIINAPQIAKEKKVEILLAAAEKTDSKAIENLLKLLVEKGRISLVSDIASVLRKELAKMNKRYSGTVYSDVVVDAKILEELSQGLGKKFGATIALEFKQNDFDGIKVDVEGLGVEISFSKSRINKQIVAHILQAI